MGQTSWSSHRHMAKHGEHKEPDRTMLRTTVQQGMRRVGHKASIQDMNGLMKPQPHVRDRSGIWNIGAVTLKHPIACAALSC
jgi:hypothetical protein